jgi:hypothetical protein
MEHVHARESRTDDDDIERRFGTIRACDLHELGNLRAHVALRQQQVGSLLRGAKVNIPPGRFATADVRPIDDMTGGLAI